MVTESLTFNMIENHVIDEDYPSSFDMEHFKQLKRFNERVRYCDEHLTKISSGSARIVYIVDDKMVLKLAKNEKVLLNVKLKYVGVKMVISVRF